MLCGLKISGDHTSSAYVSIRQHTSAYVSLRQHTSAYLIPDEDLVSACLGVDVSGYFAEPLAEQRLLLGLVVRESQLGDDRAIRLLRLLIKALIKALSRRY